jgi:hypothetical protein
MAAQKRDFVERKFNPTNEGDEHDPPARFNLEEHTARQTRRTDREIWRDEAGTYKRVVLGVFTRREVSALVADGADWLAYLGEDD